MSETSISPQTERRLRLAALVLGVALIGAGVFGEMLLRGSGWGFGATQLAVVVLGAILVIGAWLGRRVPAAYRGGALLFMNTLALLLAIEVTAAVILVMLAFAGHDPESEGDGAPDRRRLAYYERQPWGSTYWGEYAQVSSNTSYRPYVIWRSSPFNGKTITVEPSSYTRPTPGSRCDDAGAYRIFAFGGSGMWGVGSPDSLTLPAQLLSRLTREGALAGRSLCVVNFGERAHVSSQGVIQLLRELQHGNVPDLALFYDSVNDVFTAGDYNQPGLHMRMDRIAERLETTGPLSADWLDFSRLFRLITQVVPPESTASRFAAPSVAPDTLAARVVDVYLANYRAVEGLARAFGFAFEFFWQPHILASRKELTAEERAIHAAAERDKHAAAMKAAFAHVARVAPQLERLHYLGDVFDRTPSLVYIDSHHVTPEGNALVAARMAEVVGRR